MARTYSFLFFSALILLASCSSKIKENEDEIYSRHLQKHIDLTVVSTPVPKDKGAFNLLLLNDGQDMEMLRIRNTVDSLYRKKLIQPLIVVGIHAYDRMKEYGAAGFPDYQNNGADAEKYSNFIIDELLPFIKKRSGVRKFNSVVVAGTSLGGLSAFDVAWNHADKIDKVGALSASFWYRDKAITDSDYSDNKNRIIINMVRSSRKRPHLKYWFYAGSGEESDDRDKDGIIDVVDDTKDLIELIKMKKVCPPADIVYTEVKDGKHDPESWSQAIPVFLTWAFRK